MDSGNSGSSSCAEEECDSRATLHHQPPPYNNNNFNNQINNPFLFSSTSQQQQHQHQLVNQINTNFFPQPSIVPSPLPPTRNPKKRSRASRRAPTTVLTTDTSNFRAMVQEFTGIPASPFTSPTLATSFDLFGTPSAMTMRSNLPSYLLSSSSPTFVDSMQNQVLLNPKTTDPDQSLYSSNGFGAIEILEHHTALPDLISATTSARNHQQVERNHLV